MSALSIRSLRAKLLLFSLLLVVVSGGVFGLIAFAGARLALENAVGPQLAMMAEDAADTIAAALADSRKEIGGWAHEGVMQGVATGDADGQIARFLASLKDGNAEYFNLLCADASGRVVAATNHATLGTLHAERDWFRSALAGNEVFAGPVESAEYDRAVLEIAAPINDAKQPGAVIGVLLGVYDWEREVAVIERRLRKLGHVRLNASLLILDERGVVIANPQHGIGARLVGQNLRAAGWQAAQRSLRHRGYLVEQQADALVGYALPRGARPRWSVLAMRPLREVLLPLNGIMWKPRAWMWPGAWLFAALVVAALLAERMSRPLLELTQATQEIARAGETRRLVPVRSQDEIGQLAGAFNAMASELKRAQDDLMVAAKFAFIGEVAAGVAHEIRTPLGIMRSSAQLLGRSLPGERAEATELVETIVDEVDRLDRVVAGLLEVARPHEPLIEPTRLTPVLQRAVDFVEAQAREKSVAIHRSFAMNLRPARCDPDQIYQVALNLIINALQIMPRGGEITVRTLPATNGRVAFEVSDNGPGIPAEIQDRIFTPFFTMREGGTGLGLALVQRVVRAHKGSVSVHSVVGRGTTFRVELPTAEVAS